MLFSEEAWHTALAAVDKSEKLEICHLLNKYPEDLGGTVVAADEKKSRLIEKAVILALPTETQPNFVVATVDKDGFNTRHYFPEAPEQTYHDVSIDAYALGTNVSKMIHVVGFGYPKLPRTLIEDVNKYLGEPTIFISNNAPELPDPAEIEQKRAATNLVKTFIDAHNNNLLNVQLIIGLGELAKSNPLVLEALFEQKVFILNMGLKVQFRVGE